MSQPNFTMTILCLAASRKLSESCVAGKEITNGQAGRWIRPVSARADQAISALEMRYGDGQSASLLDIIEVPMLEARPHGHQVENHLIASGYVWQRRGRATWEQVLAATDTINGHLWLNGDSSYHGMNDKVSAQLTQGLQSSLLLIEPTRLDLIVDDESKYFGGYQRRVRAYFIHNNQHYNFVVTDPWIEQRYFAGANGTYRIEGARLCVSLPEVINGNATKLVAAVITEDRVG